MEFEQMGSVSMQSNWAAAAMGWDTEPAPPVGAFRNLESLLAALEHERIAALAYFFWEKRGCPHGSPEIDWVAAEQSIRQHC